MADKMTYIVQFAGSNPPIYIAEMLVIWNRWTENPAEAIRHTVEGWEPLLASRGVKRLSYTLVPALDK